MESNLVLLLLAPSCETIPKRGGALVLRLVIGKINLTLYSLFMGMSGCREKYFF